MFLGLPTFYNTGTAAITTGTKVITFQGAALGTLDFPAVLPGDLFMNPAEPETPPQRIESIDYAADPQTATLAFNWPGATMVDIAYEIRLVGNIERSTAQTRRYLELLGQLGYTGIAVNAFGEFADRSLYDDMVQGYTYLSFDGDGTPGSPPYLYVKKSSASADWSDPIAFVGAEGPPGPTGQAAAWRSGTGVPAGGLGNDGDMYIDLATADVYGPKTAGAWGAIAINIKGEQGNPGIDGIDGTSMLSRVRVVSEINVDISNLNNGDTIDGVVVATNWLVLLAGQTDATENGVYVIGATAGTTVRAAAFDTFDELPGTYFSVMQGTANADTLWKCSSDLGGTIGLDDLIFEMFASSEGFMSRTYASYALNSGVTYTLPSTPASDNALDVYVGGILQPKGGVAYTFSGTTLTLSEDPGATDLVEVYIFEALAMGAVPPSSVGSAEINAAQAAAIRVVLGILGTPREVLAANRTYYVRADGSDSNNGLANTAGGAFLTIAKALAVAAALDCSIYDVTIQLQAGTWTTPVVLPKMIGSGNFILLGDSVTPANVVISPAAGHAVAAIGTTGTRWFLDGFKLQASGGGASAINAQDGGLIYYKNIEFGACTVSHVRAANGQAIANGNTTISGNALIHWFGTSGGYIFDAGFTITLTGTPAFANAFAQISDGAIAAVNNNTFVGTATGKKFSGASNGVIGATLGADVNYLPGSLPGTLDSGAVYLSLMGGVRELLTANRTYYVRTDGSDNNTGLVNTAGGAFLTIQKAITVVQALDRSVYNVTISVGAGTYTSQVTILGMGPGSGSVSIVGAGSTTIISVSASCFYLRNVTITLQNMKLTTTGSGHCIYVEAGCYVSHSGLEFGASAGCHIWLEQWTRVVCLGNYTISGGANNHIFIRYTGASYECYNKTITLTGTPAFASSFVAATLHGNIIHGACTFVGSATGKRYAADNGGIIDTGGGGATYFPGSVAGTGTNLGTSPYGAYV